MKILITGAAGFIGSHMAECLFTRGFEITGLDNFSGYYDVHIKKENEAILNTHGIDVVKADLSTDDLLTILPADFDYIFHFAAQPGISSHVLFEDYLNNNIIATNNLLNFALQNKGLKMFVNISTSSVYGVNATCREGAVPEPVSFYGVTKLAAEQLVLRLARMDALKACSLRLYSVYGPRERPDKLFTRLISSTLFETPFTLFEGSDKHIRSFTYVDDIVEGIASVIGKEDVCNRQIINLGNDTEYTTRNGIECVKDILQKDVSVLLTPKRRGDQLHTKADITKAVELLGYRPSITLKDGLTEQVAWYRKQLLSVIK